MDLMKAFGLVDKHPKEIGTMEVLKELEIYKNEI